jgi:hypothetical protein
VHAILTISHYKVKLVKKGCSLWGWEAVIYAEGKMTASPKLRAIPGKAGRAEPWQSLCDPG